MVDKIQELFLMRGRVYHIGLPKTGTTSIQHVVQDFEWYCGVRQPRLSEVQDKVCTELTEFLRGIQPEAPQDLPDVFFYSEEMILVNHEPGVAGSNVRRLLSLLRPQDTVVVTVRNLRDLRVSAYYEFYRIFKELSMQEVSGHPLMKPFTQDFFSALIPAEQSSQFVFSKLEDGHAKLGEVLECDLSLELVRSQSRNKRKGNGDQVVVQDLKHVFPDWLHWVDSLLNPIMWRLNKNCPQNFVREKMRSCNTSIPRLTENQIDVLMAGTRSFE